MTNHARPQREAQKPSAFLSGAEGASNPVRFYEFDRFRIDTKRRLLTRDGEPIAIKAKALDTLVLLVQHAGRLLEKEELMNRLWPDTAVEEANLTQNIFEVRKALGEVPGEQRFIATVARRGYRFVAEVRAIGDEPSAHDDLAAGDRQSKPPLVGPERFARRTVIYAGVAAIVLSLLGTGLYVASRRPVPVDRGHLVVAPAQLDAADLRPGSADRRELVTRRPAGSLRVEQGRELRHLGAEHRWRRPDASDEFAG